MSEPRNAQHPRLLAVSIHSLRVVPIGTGNRFAIQPPISASTTHRHNFQPQTKPDDYHSIRTAPPAHPHPIPLCHLLYAVRFYALSTTLSLYVPVCEHLEEQSLRVPLSRMLPKRVCAVPLSATSNRA